MPPPVIWGARIEPWRARPVPFCLKGLRPAPETSPRRLTLEVPWRAAASCATTTWWMSGMLVCTSKSSAGNSTVPAFWPLASMMSTVSALVVASVMNLRPLHCGTNENETATATGNGALDQDEVLLGVDGVHDEVQHGHALATHATGHAHALEDTARGRRSTDRTGLAVVTVRTVRRRDTLEVVSLHDTGETLALAGADDVDLLAGFEHPVDGQFLTERVLSGVSSANLGDVTARRDACLVEVTGQRLGDLTGVDLAAGDLNGFVTVDLGGANLGDDVRGDLNDGHRNEAVLVIPDLGHAELDAEQSLGRLSGCSCHESRSLQLDLDVDIGRKVEAHQ